MQETDILVIGAGPAGVVAARMLAENGREVMLLEAGVLPRPKPCAGGLPQRTLTRHGLDPADIPHGTVREVALDGGWRRHCLDVGQAGAVVVDRAEFDALLARRARDAGARLLEGRRVHGLKRSGDGFLASTKEGDVRARIVCIADGACSPCGRDLGFERNALGFCLEADLPMREDLDPAARERAVFHLACIRDGYAWAFPRNGVFAVGIGSNQSRDSGLRDRLGRFLAGTPELRGSGMRNLRGGMIPRFTGPRPLYAERGAYLLGDAAGLVDPLTGEGVHYAMLSGSLAAEAVLGGGESFYEELLNREMIPELLYALRFARRYRFFPVWARALAMSPGRFRHYAAGFVDLMTGRVTYRDLYAKFHG